jgi:hypothetical protein
MGENDREPSPKRRYPPFYERFVPIALGVIVLIILLLLLVILAVFLGLFPVST